MERGGLARDNISSILLLLLHRPGSLPSPFFAVDTGNAGCTGRIVEYSRLGPSIEPHDGTAIGERFSGVR